VALGAVSRCQGQPPKGGPPQKGGQTVTVAPPVAPPPPPPPPEESSVPWVPIVIGIVIVGVIIIAVVVTKKGKEKESGGRSRRAGGGEGGEGGEEGKEPDPNAKPPETIINGYRIQNHLMTGQASQVWEVVEVSSGRHFAMKLLLPEKVADAEHRNLLFHEAEVGKELAHPNIVRIISVKRDMKTPHFVMEFFPSGSVKLKIVRKQMDFVRQHLEGILKQVATALAFMNAKGWVHRDVKPDNVLVNASGDVRIIDFAIAQRVQKAGLFSSMFRNKTVQGTRSYMSPEQIRGQPLDG